MAHLTVALEVEGSPPVEVDAGIAPLIEALWQRGIETVASCEDGGTSAEGGLPVGLAWVGFPDEENARRFRELGGTAILGAFPLDNEIRARAEAGGIPANSWLVTFATTEIPRLAELVGDAANARPASAGAIADPGRGTRRNDPCWCGSGQKFKRCHGDRG